MSERGPNYRDELTMRYKEISIMELYHKNIDWLERSIAAPYEDKDLTTEEINSLVPEISEFSSGFRLPIALTALHIRNVSAYSLKHLAHETLNKTPPSDDPDEKEKSEKFAIILDDMSQGIIATMNGVMVATRDSDKRSNQGEITTELMGLTMEKRPFTNFLKVSTQLVKEDLLQEKLISEDNSGRLLVDYWVNAIHETDFRIPLVGPRRINALAHKGAEISSRLYDLSYPLAVKLLNT